ncbi:MAG TPA: biotin-independent malonate decarboxylase subunit gamma [Casimicrobiaceae bacterium]|nr:biotin-independent malonate decarboxylase subunit gamma [Casimicrobiaceae bacterium]
MSPSYVSLQAQSAIRRLPPSKRIAALADDGTVTPLDSSRPSPYLARFGVTAQDDDGVATARIEVAGGVVLVAAQDERFLRGSVGANHGEALRSLFARAQQERPAAIVLLLASGGVRLHEANAAELALARALRALFDARIEGIPVLAIIVGDVFGGTSVLACAADRAAMLTSARIGLSGPKVIESVHGKWELDADRPDDVRSVFGAYARASRGGVDRIADEVDAIRGWIRMAAANALPFPDHVIRMQALLAADAPTDLAPTPLRAALPGWRREDAEGWLWRMGDLLATRPAAGSAFGSDFAHGLDAALLTKLFAVQSDARETLVIVEDSPGHEVSRAAEMRFISRYLAHHAAVLALARSRGHRLVGLLAGTGHSAAFFVNALQAPELYALPHSRVVAMEPAAIARVTGLDVVTLKENDPILGHPVRHFAALGGVAATVDLSEFERRLGREKTGA